jgi:hypothetical protein
VTAGARPADSSHKGDPSGVWNSRSIQHCLWPSVPPDAVRRCGNSKPRCGVSGRWKASSKPRRRPIQRSTGYRCVALVRELRAQSKIPSDIVRDLNVSRASVYRARLVTNSERLRPALFCSRQVGAPQVPLRTAMPPRLLRVSH